jgi:hypothetical protein
VRDLAVVAFEKKSTFTRRNMIKQTFYRLSGSDMQAGMIVPLAIVGQRCRPAALQVGR